LQYSNQSNSTSRSVLSSSPIVAGRVWFLYILQDKKLLLSLSKETQPLYTTYNDNNPTFDKCPCQSLFNEPSTHIPTIDC
jgi:hypothetical protein